MKRAASFLITVYASVPVVLHLFPWILGHAIFAHLLRLPFFVDLDRPEDVLNHTCNFYLGTEEGVSVGVWHTLPASKWEEAAGKSPEWYRGTLGDGHPVVIYLHGNVGTRALHHRVELVKILSAAGYHVLSLDYRGFGDSSGEPSEAGMTSDALYLYKWAKTQSKGSLVCLWGHSLGSGVATNAAFELQLRGSPVEAIILESPYTRIGEVVVIHPLAKMYMFLPGFDSLLWNILDKNRIEFPNDKKGRQRGASSHGSDGTAGFHTLYQTSLQARKQHNTEDQVEMISYSANLGFSHSNIYLDPNLPNVVRGFLQKRRQ
ncbi:putative monoacylglycerol lipase ABHD12-like isoform 2 [Scophthalmus maximus]|uniref:Putative monoacylglycerol lipase ABHD12-like isoform 2 n=1 Tax=Scophthalmus maximus TaxID=52904 RepID=A0A2U9CMV2_SCOMX|nr:putative monoacylglycerol lipase ABHD12-like isoform 2 [Scophthalmus maximus]